MVSSLSMVAPLIFSIHQAKQVLFQHPKFFLSQIGAFKNSNFNYSISLPKISRTNSNGSEVSVVS